MSKYILKVAQEKMAYLKESQKKVAQNIVRAREPGYKPKRLVPFKKIIQNAPMSVQLKRTRGDHLQGKVISQGMNQTYKTVEDFKKEDLSPSGNGVVLEKELMKSGEIGLEHKQASLVISEYLKLKKFALNPKR